MLELLCRYGRNGVEPARAEDHRRVGRHGFIHRRCRHGDDPGGRDDGEVELSISRIAAPVAGAIGQAFEIGPTGTQFKQPVTVMFRYDDADLGGGDPSAFATSTVIDGTWRAIAAPSIDRAAHTIAGATTHLSPYAIAKVAPSDPDGGPSLDARWSAAPHLLLVGTRGNGPFDVSATPENARLSCRVSTGPGRPEVDVDVVGSLAEGIGQITLKLKDYDVTAASENQQIEQGAGIRIEWELKDRSGSTLCGQTATTQGSLRFKAVPGADGGLFGGILKATLDANSIGYESCLPARFEASFSVACDVQP